MMLVLRCIRRYTWLYSHCWIMLIKNLLTNYNLICLSNSIRIFGMFRSVVSGMKRMNWSSVLSRKLWSNLRGPKTIVLAVLLLLSKVLFYLQGLSFCHISLSTTKSVSRLYSWSSFRGFYTSFIYLWSWDFLISFIHFHFC